jgi:hypothetical protein
VQWVPNVNPSSTAAAEMLALALHVCLLPSASGLPLQSISGAASHM